MLVKTIWKLNVFEKTLVGFFLLLIWYRSNSESPYLVLVTMVLLSLLVFQNLGASWVAVSKPVYLALCSPESLLWVPCSVFLLFQWGILFHHDLPTSWVLHHSVLVFKFSFHLVCLLIWVTRSLEVMCCLLEATFLFTTSWCPSRHWDSSYSFLFVFTQGLEHKVADCAGF